MSMLYITNMTTQQFDLASRNFCSLYFCISSITLYSMVKVMRYKVMQPVFDSHNLHIIILKKLAHKLVAYSQYAFCRFDAASSSTPIWLSGLSCSSSDTHLTDCSHDTFGSNYCTHSQDVALFCKGSECLYIYDKPTCSSFDQKHLRLCEPYQRIN